MNGKFHQIEKKKFRFICILGDLKTLRKVFIDLHLKIAGKFENIYWKEIDWYN